MKQKVPDNYQTVMPYLILKEASRFIEFTSKVFGATQTPNIFRDENIIMHGEIVIDDSTIMFADASDEFEPQTAGLFVYVDNADDTCQKAINAGGEVVRALSDQPYGRTCGVKDPCGNTWWITTNT